MYKNTINIPSLVGTAFFKNLAIAIENRAMLDFLLGKDRIKNNQFWAALHEPKAIKMTDTEISFETELPNDALTIALTMLSRFPDIDKLELFVCAPNVHASYFVVSLTESENLTQRTLLKNVDFESLHPAFTQYIQNTLSCK